MDVINREVCVGTALLWTAGDGNGYVSCKPSGS